MAQSKRRYLDHDWDSMINLRKKNRISKAVKLRTNIKRAPAGEKAYHMQPEKKYGIGDTLKDRAPIKKTSENIGTMNPQEAADIGMTLSAMHRAEQKKQPKASRAKTKISMKGKTSREAEQRIMKKSNEMIAKEIAQ